MKHRWLLILTALVVGSPLGAQDYRFSVPKCVFEVYPNLDASVRLTYEIEFANGAGAHAIDVVDVGMLHAKYNIGNMSAAIDGQPCTDIRPSEYVKPGVEVHLGGGAIPAGGQGTFTFECTMPKLVYQDTTRRDYCSLRITPTWFGEQYVQGQTDLWIFVHLPAAITDPETVLYQTEPFSDKVRLRDHLAAVWHLDGTRLTGPHLVGISFPKVEGQQVVRMTKFGLLVKWFKEHQNAQVISGLAFFVVLAIFFFARLSGGTGCSVFAFLLIGGIVLFVKSPAAHLISWPVLVLGWAAFEIWGPKRKRKYLPAIASVEGGGIKRGLTAPEAAVVLELPLNRVLTLAIFGLLKKKIVRQARAEPLMVEVAEGYGGTPAQRKEYAAQNGTVIHDYEQPFINELLAQPGKPVRDADFSVPLRRLVQQTARRMKGFDLDETREYYRYIIKRAWAEAEAIGEIEQREKKVDQDLLWLILADDYDHRFDHWHGRGWDYHPSWSRGPTVSLPRGGETTPVGGTTSLRDVAGSFAGWTENVTGQMAGRLDPTAMGLDARPGGLLDLSGFDKVTGDVLKALGESSGSGGGGGGGGCACACAGCACACACAGGGR